MNSETKLDVFGQLLNAYQNLMMKGIKIPGGNYRENITTPWNIVYDAAFPDDLPVIPKAVGVSIKEQKANQSLGGALFDAVFAANNLGRKKVGPVVNWMVDNDETYASAWLLGVWKVKETGEIVKLTKKQKDCPYCHEKGGNHYVKPIEDVPGHSMGLILREDGWHLWTNEEDAFETIFPVKRCPECDRPLNEEDSNGKPIDAGFDSGN